MSLSEQAQNSTDPPSELTAKINDVGGNQAIEHVSESHKWSVTRVGLKLRPLKRGKYGKGMITEDGESLMTWRTKGGWNGDPHHDKVKEGLGIDDEMVAMHIDKDGVFYFHQEDAGFKPPHDPQALAERIHAERPELEWGKISVEEYERQHFDKESSLSKLAQTIAEMRNPKEPRKLIIRRDAEGRMASIEEIPIT